MSLQLYLLYARAEEALCVMYLTSIYLRAQKSPFVLEDSSIFFTEVMCMQRLKRPETYVLRGKEAIEALEAYVTELKKNKPDELTETQTDAMVALAEGLISAIDEEASWEGHEPSSLLPKIKQAVGGLLHNRGAIPDKPITPASSERPHYSQESTRIK
jgi:hypothetical protein